MAQNYILTKYILVKRACPDTGLKKNYSLTVAGEGSKIKDDI